MQQAFHGELPCSKILLAAANAIALSQTGIRNEPGRQADWYASC